MGSKGKKGLVHWLNAHSKSPGEAEMLEKIWDATDDYKKNLQPDVEAGLAKFRQRQAATQRPDSERESGAKIVPMYKRRAVTWSIAAAMTLVLGAVLVFKNFNGATQAENLVAQANLQKNISLSDGSQVVLNENSQLFYPEKFTGEQRQVRLEGEGFFDIAKKPANPFWVETQLAKVEVLGTSFNVRCYPKEGFVEVFVKTGNVAVVSHFDGKRYELKPGDKLKLEKNSPNATAVSDASSNTLAWKTRQLNFKNAPFREVFSAIERLHGVKIEVEDAALLDCPYTSNIEAGQLQETLEVLKEACALKISQLAPNQFRVAGNCCK